MINEIYQDSENDNMVHDIEREIPELVVRSNDCSPACLTPPLSRSSSTVRGSGKHLEFNSEGGLCENDDDVDISPPIIPVRSYCCSAQQLMYCIVQVSTTLFVLNLRVQLRHFSRPTQKLST